MLSKNGDAVAITSSLNDAWVSNKKFNFKVNSNFYRNHTIQSNGWFFNAWYAQILQFIYYLLTIFNWRFNVSGITNIYGMKPSPANYTEPRKRPMSSMSPSIVIDKNGEAVFIIWAAGGSKITTIVAYVKSKKKSSPQNRNQFNSIVYQILKSDYCSTHLDEGIIERCCFSQSNSPSTFTNATCTRAGTDEKLVEGLRKMGHRIVHNNPIDGFASVTAISRVSGYIEITCDPRRTGSTEINVISTPCTTL